MDLTQQSAPRINDADGNRVKLSAFNVGRAYINLTGNLNHRIQFRITPDIVRETGTGSSLSGSYTFRLKYAFGQYNLDDWTTKGSWVRFGLQQTPYVDYMEGLYRYRFQGPLMVDREGYLTSSDFGVSGHYNFAGDRGDVHAGLYNGDGYTKADANDQKALQGRVSFRPGSGMWKGLSLGAFYDGDNYLRDAQKRRFVPFAVLDIPDRGRIGIEGLAATDRTSATRASARSRGISIWATPKFTKTVEGLLRHDRLEPDTNLSGRKTRDVAGVAYWVPNLQKVTAAVMVDGERVRYERIAKPDERRYAAHLLISF